jgi:uroporphyrinogen decarboxylase
MAIMDTNTQKKTLFPQQKLFLQALQGRKTDRVPFWLMRQAGRYLPEYRELRKQAGSFLDLCFNPDMACEVTLQPLRRFDMDAAILFSDILVVPYALGQPLRFIEGEGPRLDPMPEYPAFDETIFHEKLSPVYQTVEKVRANLQEDKALIGFAGAPWTVACYMVNGKGDGAFEKVVEKARTADADFDVLVNVLTEATISYLSRQIEHGADAVQVFDSWAGLLPENLFDKYVVAPTAKIVSALRKRHPETPVIGFPRGAGNNYARYASHTGVQGLGLDQKVDIASLVKETSPSLCLQGNLSPELLLAGGTAMQEKIIDILETAQDRPFIFNLGHGVIKETPPEHVTLLAETVKGFKKTS